MSSELQEFEDPQTDRHELILNMLRKIQDGLLSLVLTQILLTMILIGFVKAEETLKSYNAKMISITQGEIDSYCKTGIAYNESLTDLLIDHYRANVNSTGQGSNYSVVLVLPVRKLDIVGTIPSLGNQTLVKYLQSINGTKHRANNINIDDITHNFTSDWHRQALVVLGKNDSIDIVPLVAIGWSLFNVALTGVGFYGTYAACSEWYNDGWSTKNGIGCIGGVLGTIVGMPGIVKASSPYKLWRDAYNEGGRMLGFF